MIGIGLLLDSLHDARVIVVGNVRTDDKHGRGGGPFTLVLLTRAVSGFPRNTLNLFDGFLGKGDAGATAQNH